MFNCRTGIIFLFLSLSFNLYAQNSLTTFRHISTNNGLSNNNITAIVQDSLGFIWLGTPQGLNRYDGYEFKKFYGLPGVNNSLPGDNITSLAFSPDSILWIGTNLKGLASYNPVTGKFTCYKKFLHNSVDDSYPQITKLFNNTIGSIWLATNDGRLIKIRYSHNDLSVKLLSSREIFNYSNEKETVQIYDFYFLSESDLLVATENGLYLQSLDNDSNVVNNELLFNTRVIKIKVLGNKIFLITGVRPNKLFISKFSSGKITSPGLKFEPFFPDTRDKHAGVTDVIEYKNKIFFSLEQFRLVGYTLDLKNKIAELNLANRFADIRKFRTTDLFTDKNKYLWAITNGLGALIEQSNPAIFNTLKNIPGNSESLAPTSLRQILEDHSYKGIWIAGYQGLSLFNPDSNTIKRYPAELPIFSLALIPNQEKYILIGTDQSGLYLGNKETGETKPLNLILNDQPVLEDGHIFSIYIDKKNNVWFGCDFGLMKFKLPANLAQIPNEIKTELFPIAEAGATLNKKVTQIYPVNDSLFYLATTNYGIIKYNIKDHSHSSIEYDPNNHNSISSNTIKIIFRASNGDYWVGTTSGLNKWKEDDFKNFRNNFERILTSDGLPNNVVYGILEDNNSNLWLSTNLGLCRFNPSKFSFENFSKADGLANEEFNTNSYLKTSSGKMYFGGIYGLTFFDPDKIGSKKYGLKVVFTDFNISNKQIAFKKNISYTDHIELTSKENIFSISFSTLAYSDQQSTEYSYQLTGQDSTWIGLGRTNKITFTNVSSGNYKLRVRAKTLSTGWSDQIAELYITVLPPFWRTWWMYSIYIIIFLAGLYLLRRYELNRQKHKRAAEIEKIHIENLLEINRAKSDFFANISHELRTPLTLILGMLESLKPAIKKNTEELDIAEIERKINIAHKSGQKQLSLVNQILSLTKIDAGEEKLNASVKNIEPFIRSICSSFESLAKLNNLELSFTSDYEIIPVNFDADKIEKIMNNLLSNAIKFTQDEGNISVSINSGLSGSDFQKEMIGINRKTNRFVEIVIKDNGIGIPDEKIPHIFDRFYQADNTSTRKYEGIGIGLSLTKELVQLHNGNIDVESKSGEGTTFTVSLPIDFTFTPEEIKNFDMQNIEAIENFDLAITHRPEKTIEKTDKNSVLVVEDNPDLRYYIKDTLEENYDILEAPDGKEGIVIAEKEIPDLIITDVMMPNMNGYEMTKILRESNTASHIPIIMLTARAAEEDKLTGLEAGVDAYLTKPFSTIELLLRVRKLLELRENLYKKIGERAFTNPSELKIRSQDQVFLEKLKEAVVKNISNENFSIDELTDKFGFGKRQLHRKLKALLNVTPGVYIRKLRLNRAKELLEKGAGNVSEISLEVGYSNFAAFSKAFKEEFGIPPSQIL